MSSEPKVFDAMIKGVCREWTVVPSTFKISSIEHEIFCALEEGRDKLEGNCSRAQLRRYFTCQGFQEYFTKCVLLYVADPKNEVNTVENCLTLCGLQEELTYFMSLAEMVFLKVEHCFNEHELGSNDCCEMSGNFEPQGDDPEEETIDEDTRLFSDLHQTPTDVMERSSNTRSVFRASNTEIHSGNSEYGSFDPHQDAHEGENIPWTCFANSQEEKPSGSGGSVNYAYSGSSDDYNEMVYRIDKYNLRLREKYEPNQDVGWGDQVTTLPN